MAGGPIEQKTVAGPTAALAFGYIAWALLTYIPAVKNTLPADIAAQMPVYISFLAAGIAAYLAPHTHRPDLPPLPAPAPVPAAQLKLSVSTPEPQPGQNV